MEQQEITQEVENQNNQSVQETPEQNQGVEQRQDKPTQPASQEDVISRVTRFINEQNPQEKSPDEIDEEVFNDAELRQKIEQLEQSDPDLAKQVKLMRKSAMSGLNSKFQEMSEMKKQMEQIRQTMAESGRWTPERIQQLMNDPEFVKAAQSVAGTPETEEDEYIPDSVKKKLAKLDEIEKKQNMWSQQQWQQHIQQEHSQLAQRYGNYDPKKIDEIRADLLQGKINPNSETIYKAFYHDENVTRAYEMGKKDASGINQEKSKLSSYDYGSQKPNGQLIPGKEESDKSFLNRIIQTTLSQHKK